MNWSIPQTGERRQYYYTHFTHGEFGIQRLVHCLLWIYPLREVLLEENSMSTQIILLETSLFPWKLLPLRNCPSHRGSLGQPQAVFTFFQYFPLAFSFMPAAFLLTRGLLAAGDHRGWCCGGGQLVLLVVWGRSLKRVDSVLS